MTVAVLLTAFAVLLIGIVFALAKGSVLASGSMNDLLQNARPTDLEAFVNLVDPNEEQFLRSKLSAAEFAVIKRARLAASAEYIACILHNAGILASLGGAFVEHEAQNKEIEESTSKLSKAAIQLRLACFAAFIKLGFGYLFPSSEISFSRIIQDYRSVKASVRDVCQVQYPQLSERVIRTI